MPQSFKTGLGVLGLSVVLLFLAGCGSDALSAPKSVLLCGFENLPDTDQGNLLKIPDSLKKPVNTQDDFGWFTGGYVSLKPSKQYASQGKYCAEVQFTVPADYKSQSETAQVKHWESGLTLSLDSPTKLPLSDWSPYGELKVDFYNPAEQEYQAFLRVIDTHSNRVEVSDVVKAKGKCTVAMPVTQIAQARVDLQNIQALTIYLDTVNQRQDPVLYVDNVRLEKSSSSKKQ